MVVSLGFQRQNLGRDLKAALNEDEWIWVEQPVIALRKKIRGGRPRALLGVELLPRCIDRFADLDFLSYSFVRVRTATTRCGTSRLGATVGPLTGRSFTGSPVDLALGDGLRRPVKEVTVVRKRFLTAITNLLLSHYDCFASIETTEQPPASRGFDRLLRDRGVRAWKRLEEVPGEHPG
ncbi:MAG: hypothetical protein LAO51_08705 [Acidobacteriia bacterium]|nr:hypothetical protein [Terriglobia bacterium]